MPKDWKTVIEFHKRGKYIHSQVLWYTRYYYDFSHHTKNNFNEIPENYFPKCLSNINIHIIVPFHRMKYLNNKIIWISKKKYFWTPYFFTITFHVINSNKNEMEYFCFLSSLPCGYINPCKVQWQINPHKDKASCISSQIHSHNWVTG
jgi:hypothetical protein